MIFFDTVKAFFNDQEYRDLLITTFIILLIGTVVYHYLENWSWLDSFYFSFITLTTIGFGDFAPKTDAGKIFTTIYITVGVGIILAFINTVYKHYSRKKGRNKKSDD
ncbi:MAG: potassium channel family protein [Bacteroidota bacterium]